MLHYALAFDVIQVRDGINELFSIFLTKVNTVPCMFTVTLSLGQRVDQ